MVFADQPPFARFAHDLAEERLCHLVTTEDLFSTPLPLAIPTRHRPLSLFEELR